MNKLISYDEMAKRIAEIMSSSEVLHEYNQAIEKANEQVILLSKKFEKLRAELAEASEPDE